MAYVHGCINLVISTVARFDDEFISKQIANYLPNKVLTNDLKPCSFRLTNLCKPPPTLQTSPTLISTFCMTSHVRNQMYILCSYKDVGTLHMYLLYYGITMLHNNACIHIVHHADLHVVHIFFLSLL